MSTVRQWWKEEDGITEEEEGREQNLQGETQERGRGAPRRRRR